jgi:hypothetical protein
MIVVVVYNIYISITIYEYYCRRSRIGRRRREERWCVAAEMATDFCLLGWRSVAPAGHTPARPLVSRSFLKDPKLMAGIATFWREIVTSADQLHCMAL